MLKTFKKLKSSALLIAMVIGVVVSATLFSLVAATNQYLKSAGQSRDGKIAYQAALSGIEDGLLQYRYAAALGKTNLVMRKFDNIMSGTFDKFTIDGVAYNTANPKSYYNLSIRSDAVSVGEGDFSVVPVPGAWTTTATTAIAEKALPLLADDTLEIDLDYLIRKTPIDAADPLSIDLYFSDPFVRNTANYGSLPLFFSATSYQLVNYGAQGEKQIVSEGINNITTQHSLSVTNFSVCWLTAGAQCRLRITPRIASRSMFGTNTNNRFNGSKTTAPNQKYVFFKILAKKSGTPIPPQTYKPGTVVVEAIGVSGDAKRKLQVQLDSSSGKYLGMFDFGVYCGDKCVMP